MFTIDFAQCQTFWQLLVRSFKVCSPGLKDKIINNIVFAMLNIIIFAYVMPQMGLDRNIGSFMVATMPLSCAFFVGINSIYTFLSDISSEGSNLQYELTLPIPQWLTFAKYAFENMYQALTAAIFILPCGSLLLYHDFSWLHFSIMKFHFLLIIASLFFGFFGLWITSITKDFSDLDNMWIRIVFPMWFLGGFQFSWQTLYSISPALAYFNLLNPLTYALEGGRAAALDPALSLPYWNCIVALIGFTILFGYLGIKNLKKRLDCL
jgi:ABC-type polysaccharide/polyol phosphate export permease